MRNRAHDALIAVCATNRDVQVYLSAQAICGTLMQDSSCLAQDANSDVAQWKWPQTNMLRNAADMALPKMTSPLPSHSITFAPHVILLRLTLSPFLLSAA